MFAKITFAALVTLVAKSLVEWKSKQRDSETAQESEG